MSLEIHCPSCNRAWHVDQPAPQGEMLCPVCMTRIDLSRKEPTPPSAPRVPSPEVEQRVPDEVVCPRCNLHFSPFSKRWRPDAARGGRRKTVLVVDDQDYFREFARDALSGVFDVRTAASAHDARLAVGRGGIDLIVLDVSLDEPDAGRELLLTLRPKPCPIVIFTAQDESEMYGGGWGELESMGADALVIKGMQSGESLLRKVAVLLGTSPEELEERKPIG